MKYSDKIKKDFGDIDIYLFDQILKGRFDNRKTILDAGCGIGRNLRFFLNNDFEVYGVDENPAFITQLKNNISNKSQILSEENFSVASLDVLPFSENKFDFIICNAVLHFASNEIHFNNMLTELWRVLKNDGVLFIRLATSIGIESKIQKVNERWYKLPDETERFLADEHLLLFLTKKLNAELLDPIKTTNVQNQRCMTTWVLKK